jgi:hypothetical protein
MTYKVSAAEIRSYVSPYLLRPLRSYDEVPGHERRTTLTEADLLIAPAIPTRERPEREPCAARDLVNAT